MESAPFHDVTGKESLPGTTIENVRVASASYDGGYPLENTHGGIADSDLQRGYTKKG